ncbi:MAG: SDR family oxidoreductase [Kutzneria sp.]|nr:SDR family oxidoreductase [Kutzneria sp.]
MTTTSVALVTGANKGIGREIARGLATRGCTVLGSARDERRGRAAVAELNADGRDVRFVQLDVTDERSIAAAARGISEEFGRLDVLVNNAGVVEQPYDTSGPVSVAAMRAVYETNVFGVVAVTDTMLPLLRRSDAGRIVNVSSRLGSLTAHTSPGSELPLFMAYNTSKSALNAVTVCYARQLADTVIRVNACAPGMCATDLNGHRGDRTAEQGARIAIELATIGWDGPTGGFFDDDGSVPW